VSARSVCFEPIASSKSHPCDKQKEEDMEFASDFEKLLAETLGARPVEKKNVGESWDQAVTRIFGRDPLLCPACGKARMVIREIVPPMRL
jgi:hypothetical protein